VPATHVAFYFENLLTFFPPQAQEDGSLAIAFPQGETPLAGFDRWLEANREKLAPALSA
jgi:hypothetical protein